MTKKSYLSTGRIKQKRRTRDLLLEVAASLIRTNAKISIANVADVAGVSRHTAYRYFPTTDLLVANAALWKVANQDQYKFDEAFREGSTPFENVDAVVVEADRSTAEHENEFRAMLRVSLEQGKANRIGRAPLRQMSLENAVADLRSSLGKAAFDKLVCALCLTVGIESLIVLNDICQLKAGKARDVRRWAAKALVTAALAEAKGAQTGRKTPVSRA